MLASEVCVTRVSNLHFCVRFWPKIQEHRRLKFALFCYFSRLIRSEIGTRISFPNLEKVKGRWKVQKFIRAGVCLRLQSPLPDFLICKFLLVRELADKIFQARALWALMSPFRGNGSRWLRYLLWKCEAATFQIHKYKYKIQNTQIHKYTNTQIQIQNTKILKERPTCPIFSQTLLLLLQPSPGLHSR